MPYPISFKRMQFEYFENKIKIIVLTTFLAYEWNTKFLSHHTTLTALQSYFTFSKTNFAGIVLSKMDTTQQIQNFLELLWPTQILLSTTCSNASYIPILPCISITTIFTSASGKRALNHKQPLFGLPWMVGLG